MNRKDTGFPLLMSAIMAAFLAVGNVMAVDSDSTRLLISRNAEFNKEILRVSENVYTAVGYAVSPVSMIVGPQGIVIIDAGLDVASSREIRGDFRRIVDKPVKAIIFTHGHPDHTHGASAFMDSTDVQVWAREGFPHEQHTLESAGILIQKKRGKKQAGFMLSPEQRINNGIAKAFWPDRKGGIWGADHKISPSHIFNSERQKINIAGLDLELVAATGETHDGLYLWYPAEHVVFAGDNFYKSWPNLYALRGTPYRDIRGWANVIDMIMQEDAVALVGGHTRPIIGKDDVNQTLANYRDAILFLFDKTVEGINKGLTPNQLVDYVVLPEKYKNLDYLRPYYGNPDWAVRAIFSGYLGWFDGNATNLFPLNDKQEAQRIVKMLDGQDALSDLITGAINEQDYQWAAVLCDYLLSVDPKNKAAMLRKADALTALAQDKLTTTARNYYLSSAIELRKQASALASE
ncbi:alkyl/aryl-sulfatase [Porticoccaceae bacterium]|nr:alkyl/aryl-sulfatase [Porticoccaceae bacterium]MDB2558810.1 alkyl/aryl-sulfatase [Porticoccaceae bacterium]